MTFADILKAVKKHVLVTCCAGATVVLVGFYFFRSGGIEELEATKSDRSKVEQTLSSNVIHATRLQEQYEALVASNALIQSRMVKVSDLARNQQYFYKIEADAGVKLTALGAVGSASGTKPTAKMPYPTAQFSCTVQGTFPQVLLFLRQLEGGQMIQRVRSATLAQASSTPDDANDPKLALTVVVEFLGES